MTSEKSDKIKWKEIWIISLISALISVIVGIFLIHYEIFVTPDKPSPTDSSPHKLTPIASENRKTSSPDVSTHSDNSNTIKMDYEQDSSNVPPPQPSKCETAKSDDLKTQLKCLHNPYAPFTVSLWLDKRGKKQFNSHQKVTIGYQVNGLKKGSTAYLTLLNISPSGHLAIIFSEPIEVGKVYGQLTEQSNVATVKQINLEMGQEYFKAIGTIEPIDWEMFIKAAAKNGKPPVKFWGTVELMVKVK